MLAPTRELAVRKAAIYASPVVYVPLPVRSGSVSAFSTQVQIKCEAVKLCENSGRQQEGVRMEQ